MFDVIGDIHGHAGELRLLLERLGYHEQGGVYRHPQRQVVFLGDWIDRGPRIRETLEIVRGMIEGESAFGVLGNHEFNAIAFATPDPLNPGSFLRPQNEHNIRQHAATMAEFAGRLDWPEWLDWFRTIPLWLEWTGMRAVHACWHPPSLATLAQGLKEHHGLSTGFIAAASRNGTPLFEALETVLKGIEVRLPEGVTYLDKDGQVRRRVRLQWYRVPVAETWRTYTLSAPVDSLPATPYELGTHLELVPYPPEERPVFFGHYWLNLANGSTPQLQSENAACLDYSIARGGQLCAYRWSGERALRPENFVTVPAIPQ